MRKFAAGDYLDGGSEVGREWYGGVNGFAANDELKAAVLRLPSFGGHPICADLVSVREDVHCESTAQEIHAGVPA